MPQMSSLQMSYSAEYYKEHGIDAFADVFPMFLTGKYYKHLYLLKFGKMIFNL